MQDDLRDLMVRVSKLERDVEMFQFGGWCLVALFAAKIAWDWWSR